jgi:collagenase-like PrtC family protease
MNYYTLEEIKDICKNESCDVFVKLNKNFMNEDLDSLKEILLELEELKIAGIFFYDLAVLEFKRELNLKVPLIWNQTHMVNNYRTCNYYYSRGVEYALLGKEITLEEILEIASKSNISTMVEVVSKPSVAFSKRKLLTNYFTDANLEKKNELTIKERGTNEDYHLYENEDGTSFFLDIVTNGTGVIKDLYDGGVDFIILREYGLEDSFEELVKDTSNYLKEGCSDSKFVEKYKKLGDSTNFFFKKTIYKVKKNG